MPPLQVDARDISNIVKLGIFAVFLIGFAIYHLNRQRRAAHRKDVAAQLELKVIETPPQWLLDNGTFPLFAEADREVFLNVAVGAILDERLAVFDYDVTFDRPRIVAGNFLEMNWMGVALRAPRESWATFFVYPKALTKRRGAPLHPDAALENGYQRLRFQKAPRFDEVYEVLADPDGSVRSFFSKDVRNFFLASEGLMAQVYEGRLFVYREHSRKADTTYLVAEAIQLRDLLDAFYGQDAPSDDDQDNA